MSDTGGGTPRSSRGSAGGAQYTELRAMVQEAVQSHTQMRRDQLRAEFLLEHPGSSEQDILDFLNKMQPHYDEFDPVVQLAIFAADHRYKPEARRQAMSDAAPYLRPKLKQVEHINDPRALEEESRKNVLAARLLDVLTGATASASSAVRGGPPSSTTGASSSSSPAPRPYDTDGDGPIEEEY